MYRYLASVILAALLAAATQASDNLEMVGEARLSVMFWSVYDSRLYSEDGRYDPGQRPLRLEIEYLRDISASALVDRTGEEWDHLNLNHEGSQAWLEELRGLWPDVTKNDVLALDLDEQNRSTFLLNGEPLGVIEDPAFGEHFLAIWLSPDTSRPALRRALIGSL
ncbi:hypothetical protein CWI75_04820 [Kineobactrum sediminis]|uniref:Chalcone isomerase domain-containing protein n=1 Tax=Kineobactrum sediminis TaxID=1905677 RepID=A0A2N5Y5J5_9GAMM|nr:chalcone isomerase family protein [Kineobactrum sediminis]PLW83673.1 hypothetical protein CWI75_04820 [Kineobactrum sediminis]